MSDDRWDRGASAPARAPESRETGTKDGLQGKARVSKKASPETAERELRRIRDMLR